MLNYIKTVKNIGNYIMEKNKIRYVDIFIKKSKKHRYKVALSISSGIIRSILMLLPTMMIQDIMNGISDNVGIGELSRKGFLYVLFPAIVLVLYVIDTWISRFVFDIIKEIRLEALQNLAKQPTAWIREKSHQELYNKVIQATTKVADFYFSTLSNLIWYSTTIIVGFLLMAQIDFMVATALLFISIVQLISVWFCQNASKKSNQLMNEANVEGNSVISDSIEYCSYIKLLSLSNKMDEMDDNWARHYLRANNLKIGNGAVADMLAILCEIARVTVLLIFSRHAWSENNLLVGDVYAMNAYIAWLTPVFFGLQKWFVEFFVSRSNQERIEDILVLPQLESFGNMKCGEVSELAIENVSFSYGAANSKKVVRDVSINGKQGEMIVIVGPSGCGKTTLMKLLLQLEQNYSGEIRMNDTNINKYEEKSYREQVCAAMQETQLLELSLRENLLISGTFHTDDEIMHLMNAIGLMEIIDKLPNGLDTMIVRETIAFSDGERKRIGIARVLLSNASLMIFDEPTASLDNATKFQVMKTIRNANKDKIVIVITHDNDILLKQDRVIRVGDVS